MICDEKNRAGTWNALAAADFNFRIIEANKAANCGAYETQIFESAHFCREKRNCESRRLNNAAASWTAPVLWRFSIWQRILIAPKAPEDWRSPKPCGDKFVFGNALT